MDDAADAAEAPRPHRCAPSTPSPTNMGIPLHYRERGSVSAPGQIGTRVKLCGLWASLAPAEAQPEERRLAPRTHWSNTAAAPD